jgi:hypothetical protein
VVVSALALVVFIITEGRRIALSRLWLPIIATLLVGVSLGFPLFLYLRQRKLYANGVALTCPGLILICVAGTAPVASREKRPFCLHGKYLPESDGRRAFSATGRQSQGH